MIRKNFDENNLNNSKLKRLGNFPEPFLILKFNCKHWK